MTSAQSPSFKLALALLGLVAVVDIVWLWRSTIAFDWASLETRLGLALIYAALAAFFVVISRRLAGDGARIAKILRGISGGAQNALFVLAFIAPFTALGAITSYLSVTTALPLQDANLAMLDRALGFDWLGFLAWTNDRPALGQALTWAYRSSLGQVVALTLLLAIFNRTREVWEFLALFALTLVIVIVISALVPAAGAYAFHAPAKTHFSNLNPAAGMWHYADFVALRDGSFAKLSLDRVEGLITFPSFHTVLAILVTYSVRDVRLLFGPVAVLNALVIVSTLTEGGHYLVDVLAGGAIAVACIVIVRRLEGTLSNAGPAHIAVVADELLTWHPAR
jgi:membrane-associated phospholipid phosphatase